MLARGVRQTGVVSVLHEQSQNTEEQWRHSEERSKLIRQNERAIVALFLASSACFGLILLLTKRHVDQELSSGMSGSEAQAVAEAARANVSTSTRRGDGQR